MARPPASNDSGDDQPWLAEGVREERSTLVPRARLFGGGLLALLLAVLVALGVYLASGHKSDGSGGYARPEDAPLITADAGAYKVQPADPGGARITGIDDSVAAVAGGRDQGSQVAADEPEEPLTRPTTGTTSAAAPSMPPTDLLPPARPSATPPASPPPAPPRPIAAAPVVVPATPAKAPLKDTLARNDAPLPARLAPRAATKSGPSSADDPLAAPAAKPAKLSPTTGGTVVLQLGAFSTREKAEAAWSGAAGDGALSGLTKRIEPVERGGTTLYRLRAAGVPSRDAAKALCGRIKSAGTACIVAD